MAKNAAQVIVEVLESAGVKHIYGVVGDTLNFVIDAISKSSIEWVHTRHEEVGAFAAGGGVLREWCANRMCGFLWAR